MAENDNRARRNLAERLQRALSGIQDATVAPSQDREVVGERGEGSPLPALRPPGMSGPWPVQRGYAVETPKQTERRSLFEGLRAIVNGDRTRGPSLLGHDWEGEKLKEARWFRTQADEQKKAQQAEPAQEVKTERVVEEQPSPAPSQRLPEMGGSRPTRSGSPSSEQDRSEPGNRQDFYEGLKARTAKTRREERDVRPRREQEQERDRERGN